MGRFGSLLAARHTHTLEGHQGAVPGHSAKRDLVATAGFDGTCRLWRPEARQPGFCNALRGSAQASEFDEG